MDQLNQCICLHFYLQRISRAVWFVHQAIGFSQRCCSRRREKCLYESDPSLPLSMCVVWSNRLLAFVDCNRREPNSATKQANQRCIYKSATQRNRARMCAACASYHRRRRANSSLIGWSDIDGWLWRAVSDWATQRLIEIQSIFDAMPSGPLRARRSSLRLSSHLERVVMATDATWALSLVARLRRSYFVFPARNVAFPRFSSYSPCGFFLASVRSGSDKFFLYWCATLLSSRCCRWVYREWPRWTHGRK